MIGFRAVVVGGALVISTATMGEAAWAQTASQARQPRPTSGAATNAAQPVAVAVPADFVLGPEDTLTISFWKDQEMTQTGVVVRPDGKITLPLLGDIEAAGLSPDALKEAVQKSALRFIEDPTVTVVVTAINSRKVFITGEVANPGAFPLVAPRTVMQIIALAGGLNEYADKKNISIVRSENGKTVSFKFNYNDVSKGKNLEQNIQLKPGDTVIVP